MSSIDKVLICGYLESLGKSVVQKMIDLYAQQSVIYINDIQAAVDAKSQALWQIHCHKMKGAAGSVGFIEVHKHLVLIEKANNNWYEKQSFVTDLKQLNSETMNCFQQWLALQ